MTGVVKVYDEKGQEVAKTTVKAQTTVDLEYRADEFEYRCFRHNNAVDRHELSIC